MAELKRTPLKMDDFGQVNKLLAAGLGGSIGLNSLFTIFSTISYWRNSHLVTFKRLEDDHMLGFMLGLHLLLWICIGILSLERFISVWILRWPNQFEFYRQIPNCFNPMYLLIIYFIDIPFSAGIDVFIYMAHYGCFIGLDAVGRLLAIYTSKILIPKSNMISGKANRMYEDLKWIFSLLQIWYICFVFASLLFFSEVDPLTL